MDGITVNKKQVLLVEDDSEFRKAICNLLQPLGYHVREAENGLVAKTVFDLNPNLFDLIISDVRMPAMTGIDLLKHVRQTNSTIKFAIMTGFSELIEAKQAFDLGANEFLTKPFRMDAFRSAVHNCLNPKTVADVADREEGIRYCAIGVEELVTSSQLVADLYVHLGGEKYIKIAHRGDLISIERLKCYQEKRVQFFYVRPEDLGQLVGLNLKINQASSRNPKFSREARLKLLANTAKLISQSFYYDTIDRATVKEASQVMENTLSLVGEEPNIMSLLSFLQSDGGYDYSHGVAVSMYSCMIARHMGLTSQAVQMRLALGGLMHDIGKKEIPLNVLSKSRIEMTAEEYKLFQSHCQRGKEILSDIPGIPEDVIQIVAHHHETNMGTGPYHLRNHYIHPLAKIVAVADCFFHTMRKMQVGDASGILNALNKMTVNHELEFDLSIIKALTKLVSGK